MIDVIYGSIISRINEDSLSTAEAEGILGFTVIHSQWKIIVHFMRFGYDAAVTDLCQISRDTPPPLLLLVMCK